MLHTRHGGDHGRAVSAEAASLVGSLEGKARGPPGVKKVRGSTSARLDTASETPTLRFSGSNSRSYPNKGS